MLITNKILSIMGLGISPEPNDATVRVENVLVPTFSPRSPLSSIISTPPTGSLFLAESHLAYGIANQGASLAILDTVLTRLSAGLWHLNISYCWQATVAHTVASNVAGDIIAVMLRKDAATGSIPLILGAGTTIMSSLRGEFTVNLPSDGWEIRFRLPATVAADSNVAACSVVASKLS